MGSLGNNINTAPSPEKFVYHRSEDIKPWSEAEDKRAEEMSRFVDEKVFRLGDEYYEENIVEELDSYTFPADSNYKEDEVTLTKMNLIHALNWDENDRRVKKGKALTGSTYYIVQTDNGAIDESHFAYKTKADAVHAMQLYIDEEKQFRAYMNSRKKG